MELRTYIENKMETDYFYKPYTIARSLDHGQVKKIYNVIGRDELSLDMSNPKIAEARKDQVWVNKSTKFLDLVSGF